MTRLQRLHAEQGQSPWLDDLTRGHLTGGELRLVAAGVRGVTSNPTIFARAISGSQDYDDQFRALTRNGATATDTYWWMVVTDVEEALAQLRPVHEQSSGGDGFVSVELGPELAHDTTRSIDAARALHERIDEPNLFVKIPAIPEGVPAVREMVAEGRSINITLLFSLERYDEVIEAYLAGLEACAGDLRHFHSVASFFVSRVDTEVDQRSRRSAPTRRWPCAAGPPWPRPSWPTSSSGDASAVLGGRSWWFGAPACSLRCGPRRRRRTRRTPTPST